MVDLVKLRKKAKEKKGEQAMVVDQPAASQPAAPPPMTSASPERVSPSLAALDSDSPAPSAAEAVDSKLDRFKRDAGRLRDRLRIAADLPVEEAGDSFLELLTFRLCGENYAVEIENIVELVPPHTTTRIPNADATIVGITSLRGTIVTVVDLRRKLGHPPAAKISGDSRMIVVEHEGESSGFVVDLVSRVIKVDPSKIENHPVVSATEQNQMIRGVFQQPGGLTILLDLNRVLG